MAAAHCPLTATGSRRHTDWPGRDSVRSAGCFRIDVGDYNNYPFAGIANIVAGIRAGTTTTDVGTAVTDGVIVDRPVPAVAEMVTWTFSLKIEEGSSLIGQSIGFEIGVIPHPVTANAAFDNLRIDTRLQHDDDGDGIDNRLDLDSDNDGITDNVEAQSTNGYAAPTGTDTDGDGLDDAYEGTGDEGLTVVDTDGDTTPDFLDTDSENDGISDADEAGHGVSQASIDASADTDEDGLMDVVEGADASDGYDVNDENVNGSGYTALADSDADLAVDRSNVVPFNIDHDWRESLDTGG